MLSWPKMVDWGERFLIFRGVSHLKLLASSLSPGVTAALASALLFGAGTPLAKWLLGEMSPWMLAGLLYLGSGLGLFVYRRVRRAARPRLAPGEMRWLAAAVLCGGGIAPVLLMYGLSAMPSSHAALLLNAEAVLTAVLAWMVFKENVDRRIALGMAAIVAGALLLSWPQPGQPASTFALLWPACAVLLACFLGPGQQLHAKGVAGRCVMDCLRERAGRGPHEPVARFPGGSGAAGPGNNGHRHGSWPAGLRGEPGAFVVGLRHLGTSRAGAYFSTAPFVGALFSVVFLAEPRQLETAGGRRADGIRYLAAPDRAPRACAHA